ncbi:SdpI family protein [Aneurinibacillus terranovensis]|uniref:SdpI family protein n=1 Tax=Aneurinibacillus terranovensis TaxID=278991 RepID=UPI000418BA63|nr:SdpI family protein [Aneurinibacillus terranovensis]
MKKNAFPVLTIILGLLISLASYPYLPERIATHWGWTGTPDSYSSKLFGILIIPVLMIALYAGMRYMPRLDPNRANYEKFGKSYDLIINFILTFLLILHGITLVNGMGFKIDISFAVPFMVGILFIALGNMMPRFKQTYFVGIRTPWTISSEQVWRKTHRLSARVFFAGGVILAASAFLPLSYRFPVFIAVIILIVAVPNVLSYYYFKKETANK